MTKPIDMFGGVIGAAQPPVKTPESADEAGRQFEQMMAEMMLKEMRKSMPKDGLFGSSSELQTFTEMLDRELAERLTEGPGLGLKAQIADAIRQHQGAVVPESASLGGRWPVKGTLTSSFGARLDPITGRRELHPGVDIAAPRGAPVRAAEDGVVSWAGTVEGYGRVVYIDHGDGLETRYAHCEALEVHPGQAVRAGELIATVGSTGHSTGPHLHFESRRDGVPVDPSQVFSWKSDAPPQDNFRRSDRSQ